MNPSPGLANSGQTAVDAIGSSRRLQGSRGAGGMPVDHHATVVGIYREGWLLALVTSLGTARGHTHIELVVTFHSGLDEVDVTS